MGIETWSLTAKPCDSCKAASATVFCRADSAFLCIRCDSDIHAANKLASRHGRVWVCEVCEHAPASVTCKADAAALCATCDHDIHSANPLALRHERIPLVPFFDSASAARYYLSGVPLPAAADNDSSSKGMVGQAEKEEEVEVEARSWLLSVPNYNNEVEPKSPEFKSIDYLFNDMDPDLDMDLIPGDQKRNVLQFHHQDSDGVVPVQNKNECLSHLHGPSVDGYPSYDMDFAAGSAKPFMYNFSPHSICQSVSSSSMEVGVVPDHHLTADVARTEVLPLPVAAADREARVLRYREKRKNRKFQKTIRYASRKAYAETRPRIKGRFAKRLEAEANSLLVAEISYGVVPIY